MSNNSSGIMTFTTANDPENDSDDLYFKPYVDSAREDEDRNDNGYPDGKVSTPTYATPAAQSLVDCLPAAAPPPWDPSDAAKTSSIPPVTAKAPNHSPPANRTTEPRIMSGELGGDAKDESGSSSDSDNSDKLDPPQFCNLCNEELCYQCDPLYDHVCGMYLEAARKRNGNVLRGNEYMSMFIWSWEGMKNVVIPGKFFRDLELGTNRPWRGTMLVVPGYALWVLATMLMLLLWPVLLPLSIIHYLIEDKMWRD